MTPEEQAAQEAAAAEAKAAEEAAKNKEKEQAIPKHRFDEVYQEMKTYKEQVEQYAAEQAAKEQKSLEEKEEFQTLYTKTSEELAAFKAEAEEKARVLEEYQSTVSSMVEGELKSIDEKFHSLIPEGMSPTEKLSWINRAKETGLFGAQEQREVGKPMKLGQEEVDVKDLSPLEQIKRGLKPIKRK